MIGGLWNLGLVFVSCPEDGLAVGTLKNIYWRPPVHIRDGFVAVGPISLAIATLFAQLHLAIDGEA